MQAWLDPGAQTVSSGLGHLALCPHMLDFIFLQPVCMRQQDNHWKPYQLQQIGLFFSLIMILLKSSREGYIWLELDYVY